MILEVVLIVLALLDDEGKVVIRLTLHRRFFVCCQDLSAYRLRKYTVLFSLLKSHRRHHINIMDSVELSIHQVAVILSPIGHISHLHLLNLFYEKIE